MARLKGGMGLGIIMTFIEEARIMHITPFVMPAHSEVAKNPIDLDWLKVLTDMVASGDTGR